MEEGAASVGIVRNFSLNRTSLKTDHLFILFIGWDTIPRDNEEGGIYYRGIIVRGYKTGQVRIIA
jgi:hypothetical protein